ncbi:MAG TPA: hypothetical protein VIL46_04020, partial [Gemmataceae bacterium]
MSRLPALALALSLSALPADAEEPPAKPELLEVRKIWDRDPHSAFTDLIRHDGKWFCAFRAGKGHVSPDGALQVLTSADGEAWEPIARVTSRTADLRDPKLWVTPDGRLMMTAAAALHQPAEHKHQTMAWFSRDGKEWGAGVPVGEPDCWLWRVTWHEGAAYGFGYRTAGEQFVRLYRSGDGKTFDTLVGKAFAEGYPNETSLVFAGDVAYCLLRRDGEPNTGLLGTAKAPFKDWDWKDLGVRLGGPKMLRLPDGRAFAVVRLYSPKVRTALCEVDLGAGTIREVLPLPSGGDTSYAGLVWHGGLLWVS